MNYFLTKIQVNKIFHLQNFEINLDEKELKHLILTGKNGSGKTVLVEAIVNFLDQIKGDTSFYFAGIRNDLVFLEKHLQNSIADRHSESDIAGTRAAIVSQENRVNKLFGKVELSFNSITDIIEKYNAGDFIFAFYGATRKTQMLESINPQKPEFAKKGTIANVKHVDQFLYFLSDLKIQEALARNENKIADADNIKSWFQSFQTLLAKVFNSTNLKLEFNYKDYSFHIVDNGKRFKFTELSDGYSAVLDIVADLIIKMQSGSSPDREYFKHGIVIIDEIETHLHLELQRIILPLLTEVFPNVQFIVTTHSPFILNSLDNAIAFDLEQKKHLDDLTEYSYEALAEGYFGVKTESSYLELRLQRFKQLFDNKEDLNESEQQELTDLDKQFEELSEIVSPTIKAQFLELKYSI